MAKKNIEEKKVVAEEEYEWNKKRILIALGCAGFLLILLSLFIISLFQNVTSGKKVLGASDSASVKEVPMPEGLEIPTKEKLEQTIDSLKVGISHLTSENFNASQSAIAKLVVNIRDMQKGKKNVVDVICDFFCKKK